MEMTALNTKRQNGTVKICGLAEIGMVPFMGVTLAESMTRVEDG
jgi:hypothetical protein